MSTKPETGSLFPSSGLIAYTDGASRGNPGPAGYGVVIQDERGATLDTLSESIGIATNNVAEYRALLAALEYGIDRRAQRLKIYCDSELMARQMQGRYRVQSPALKPLYERARKLAAHYAQFSIENLPRAQNHQADLLANQALDCATRKGLNSPSAGPAGIPEISPDHRDSQTFSALFEQGVLKPLPPLPDLENGAEYEIRAVRRPSRRLR